MSDPRRLRTDYRARHDGVDLDPAHQPGTVKVFTPEEVAAMGSGGKFAKYPKTDFGAVLLQQHEQRKVVVAKETKEALDRAGALSWVEQKEQIRRANSILLSSVLAKIENGNALPEEDVVGQLQKCSNVARQWTSEERAGGGNSGGEEPTDAELMKRRGR